MNAGRARSGPGNCADLARRALAFVVLASALVACRTEPAQVEVLFSPGGGAEERLVSLIDGAHQEIEVAMYAFTSRPLAQALGRARDRGVRVRVLLDPSFQSGAGRAIADTLAAHAVEARIDPEHLGGRGLMHNKFLVLDHQLLATGSYNWTASAETRNDENLVIIRAPATVPAAYAAQFERLWQRGIDPCDTSTVRIAATDLAALRRSAGRNAAVVGRVVSVGFSRRSGTYFLNFGAPRRGFTGVIFRSAAAAFTARGIDIRGFEGTVLELTGRVVDDARYGLEMIVEGPDQVRVGASNRPSSGTPSRTMP